MKVNCPNCGETVEVQPQIESARVVRPEQGLSGWLRVDFGESQVLHTCKESP